MVTLYENIIKLCEARGIKGGKMCTDLKISKGLLSDLKYGRRSGVSAETAQKIAAYFDVTVGYLLGKEETKKEPTLISESELDFRLIEMLTSLTPDEMRQVDAFVQGLLAARKA